MRRSASLAVLAATVVATLAFAAPSALAGPGESQFTSLANSARGKAGLRGYVVASDLVSVARRQAQRMAAKGDIWHNPNLETDVSNWRAVGENVGMGNTVEAIHQAFMNSPSHRANILDRDYTQIGVGTATDANGTVYVAQVFRQPMRTTTTVAKPAPAPTRSVTRPRVTTTTAPVARPKPAAPVVRRVDPAAALAARLRAASLAAARTPADGVGRAVTYVEVMSTLA